MAGRRRGGADSVPHNAKTALLIIDMISDFEFEAGDRLLNPALRAARNIARLKSRARTAKVPVIYVNDNLASGDRIFGSFWIAACMMVLPANLLLAC